LDKHAVKKVYKIWDGHRALMDQNDSSKGGSHE
jgi:hypothetical protein